MYEVRVVVPQINSAAQQKNKNGPLWYNSVCENRKGKKKRRMAEQYKEKE